MNKLVYTVHSFIGRPFTDFFSIDMKITPEARPYLVTLRRIPRDVFLSMVTREIDLGSSSSCVCGWAVREAIFANSGKIHNTVFLRDMPYKTEGMEVAELFGGSEFEWNAIYWGVIGKQDCDAEYDLEIIQNIEEAFLVAFAEAAEGRQLV